jgi:hypothetical protein
MGAGTGVFGVNPTISIWGAGPPEIDADSDYNRLSGTLDQNSGNLLGASHDIVWPFEIE